MWDITTVTHSVIISALWFYSESENFIDPGGNYFKNVDRT